MINISINVGNKECAIYRWPVVPHIGEQILVEINKEIRRLTIMNVIWGVTQASRTGTNYECDVAVICKRIE